MPPKLGSLPIPAEQAVGPAISLVMIAGLEALRLFSINPVGLRALLPVSLVYYAFRGSWLGATISALAIWLYLEFVFSLPGQTIIAIGNSPGRIALWAAIVFGVAYLFAGLGHRSQIQSRLLAEREERLRSQYRAAELARTETAAVLDAAGDALLLVGPTGTVVLLNDRFTELFGIPPDAGSGREVEGLRGELARVFGDADRVLARVSGPALLGTERSSETVSQLLPDPRELVLTSTPVHTPDGEFLGRLLAFHDVTEERAGARLKSDFVSQVSHELRTPLTSIMGYLDMVLEGEVGDLTGDQHAFLEIVQNNADRMLAIINDLLDMSRIEAGKVALTPQPVNLVEVVRGAVASLRPQVAAREQSLVVDVPVITPLVYADDTRVNQIVLNLLSNASKYTPPGGRILVRVRPERDKVRTLVQDSGIGLTLEEQRQLFTKFFRARNRVAQEAGGTGLGLAITRSLVELHGGELTFSSVVGEGSVFSFTLPVASQNGAAAERKASG